MVICVGVCVACVSLESSAETMWSLRHSLDNAIGYRGQYERKKVARIDSLFSGMGKMGGGEMSRVGIYRSLWKEYDGYKADSARHYRRLYCQTACAIRDSVKRDDVNNDRQLLAVDVMGTGYGREWLAGYLQAHDAKKAIGVLGRAVARSAVDTRAYSVTSFSLAQAYALAGDSARYEQWLMRSAASALKCVDYSNCSLLRLASLEYGRRDSERAALYLRCAVDNAACLGDSALLSACAVMMPKVMSAFVRDNDAKSGYLTIALVSIAILVAGMVYSLVIVGRQLRREGRRRKLFAGLSRELASVNARLGENVELRERYVSLFMDLCATYIEKLRYYQKMVANKVRARQYDDLLLLQGRERLTEKDAREFFFNFDKAFLGVYPTFVEEFNALLLPQKRIVLGAGELLNTSLRIYALVRVGIADSARIASLLFYSPQTIYNYRTQMRNNALCRDDFDAQVMRLCTGANRDGHVQAS